MVGNLELGTSLTAAAVVIIFLILIGLVYLIILQRKAIEMLKGKKGYAEKIVSRPVSTGKAEDEIDEEIVAVISAAVAVAMGRPLSNLKVKSIKSVGPAIPAWTSAGRQEQMNSRF